jgi:polar amino acid transport system substrate-binding protein
MAIVRRFFLVMAAVLAWATGLLLGANAGQAAEIKIATEGTNKPFSFFTAGGELTGFDVEITLAICKAAGLNCIMVTMDYDGMVPALKDKKVDAIASGMAITEKRKKVVAFTDSIRSAGKQFVSCAPDKFTDVSPDALKGKVIGTQSGTTAADYFQAYYAGSDVRLYKSTDEAFQDLASGRLDLVMAQIGTSYGFTSSPAGAGCKFVGKRIDDAKYFGEGVGIALRQSDVDLIAALNVGIRKVLADGTYKALNDKYFPFSLY